MFYKKKISENQRDIDCLKEKLLDLERKIILLKSDILLLNERTKTRLVTKDDGEIKESKKENKKKKKK